MPQMFYSMSLDAVVVVDLIEDPTLSVPMKLTNAGILYVKGQFIEETRSYVIIIPPDPIPAPVSSMSFDTFDYYSNNVVVDGLNSGSNEWNNITVYAAWHGKENYIGNQNADRFDSYTPNTFISTSMAGTGSGYWSSSLYDYAGREVAHAIMVADYFNVGYTLDAEVTASGTGWTSSIVWTAPWTARTNVDGIKAYDDFTLYNIGDFVSGSEAEPNFRYTAFSGPWNARTYVGI